MSSRWTTSKQKMSQLDDKVKLLKDFYSKLEDGSFKCISCLPKEKKISISQKSLFNLKRHIQRSHMSKISEYEKALAKGRDRSPDDSPGSPKQAKIDVMMAGVRRNVVTQTGVNDRIFHMIVNSGLNFTLVRNKSFRELLRYLQPTVKPLSYSALMLMFTTKFEEMKSSLKSIFGNLDYVCVTCDIWSIANKSYFGMTAHYLDGNLNRKSAALACSRLKGSHTFDVLAKTIGNKLKDFCIQNKCVGVVTDNASNFVKAFKEYAAVEVSEEEDSDVEDEQISIKNAGDLLDQRHDTEEIYHLPSHYRCVAHTLNLISTKDVESALRNAVYKKLYRSTLGKCQAIWNKQQRSTQMADEVRKKCGGMLFNIPVVTRWNSTYEALERVQRFIKESGDNLDSLMDTLELERFREAGIHFIGEYLDIMKPFAQALNILQGEINCYIGFLLPTIELLKNKLRRKEHKLCYCMPLVDALCNGIHTRFASQFQDRNYLLAAFLIPQFKSLDWVNVQETKMYILEEVKRELSSLKRDNSGCRSSNNEESEDDFFPSIQKTEPTSADILNQYSSARIATIEELDKYPEMSELFRKFNTAIPSSASVERLFSLGGGIFRKNRHSLKDENFEKQLLLKLNSSL